VSGSGNLRLTDLFYLKKDGKVFSKKQNEHEMNTNCEGLEARLHRD
jgi:hypothetical protein